MKARIIITRFEWKDVSKIQTIAENLGLIETNPMLFEQRGLIGDWILEVTEDTARWYMRHVLKLQSQFTTTGMGGVVTPIRVIIEVEE